MRHPVFYICKCCNQSFKRRRSTSKYCSRHCQSKDLFKRGITGRKRQGKNCICSICNKSFYVETYRSNIAKYCSRSCLAKIHLKKFSDYWFQKTGKPPHKYKYIIVDGKRIREHRWIMQQHLGRKLESWEHVHHINGDSSDNRLDNLMVLSNSEHQKLELQERKKLISS